MMRTLTGRMTASLSVDQRGAMTERRVRAYVGLGANLGDAERTLAAAIAAIAVYPGIHLRGVSRLYATAPVGVADQPEFRNAAIAMDAPAGPDAASGALALLGRLKRLETDFGRRPRERWGPREIDLDLLVFGRARLAVDRTRGTRSVDAEVDGFKASKRLEVPHPRAASRLFVLAPLADLAPGLVPPGWGQSVASACRRQAAIEGPRAVRPIGDWDPAAGRWRPVQPR
jgi:2-amino-4-hydroxy-6-hydroxymethyldihydropteridine diphosphokinase